VVFTRPLVAYLVLLIRFLAARSATLLAILGVCLVTLIAVLEAS